jgi:hypothetical protein
MATEAKEWIIRNQFGRRNITVANRVSLALTLDEVTRERAKKNLSAGGGDKKSDNAKTPFLPVGNPIKKVHTDEELAKIAGVSRDNIGFFGI